MIGLQQLEDVFSIAHMNLQAWLNKMGLGANGVSGE
jgi:hypothetical protein